MSKKDNRVRNWSFIMYPESMPDDWEKILDDWHIPCFCSPLHHGYQTADQVERKDHYHVCLMFEGKKSYEQVMDLIAALHCTVPKPIHSIVGYARYLTHLDNPEKEQFSEEIKIFATSYETYHQLIDNVSDIDAVIAEIEIWIQNNGVICYSDLKDYCRIHNSKWYYHLNHSCRNEILAYMKSYQYKLNHLEEVASFYSVPDPIGGDPDA